MSGSLEESAMEMERTLEIVGVLEIEGGSRRVWHVERRHRKYGRPGIHQSASMTDPWLRA
jgi:hypothetical protein